MQTIRTTPAFELPYAMHDGYGGREWYFTVNGVEYGEYDTEGEATEAMARVIGQTVEAVQ